MRGFLIEVYKSLTKSGKISAKDNYFFVGCPNNWSEKDQEKLKIILADSGIPAEVVPESRAAMMHALETGASRVDNQQLNTYILLVDIGSSTSDFTLIKSDQEIAFDFGYDLGGSQLDRLILDHMINKDPRRKDIMQALNADDELGRSNSMACELKCRRLKESYFNGNPKPHLGGIPLESTRGEIFEFAPIIDRSVIDAILNQKIKIDDLG
jgi:molecular chaperone DnaK (HSP70)